MQTDSTVGNSAEYLTTRELAELLRIKERKVYDLAASGIVPCSKATGKLLFPRAAVNAWLAKHHSGPYQIEQERVPAVFLGSHDPLLDWALRESQCGIATYFDGSRDGLERFAAHEGLACGLHVYNADDSLWNTTVVQQRCAGMPVVLLEWAKRQRGLICNQSTRARINSLVDISPYLLTPRQPGAGAQLLFLALLEQKGIRADTLQWGDQVRTEDEAVLSVLDAKADIAFGLQALAQQYRLEFLPVIEERFDLLLTRRSWFEGPLQSFIQFCQGDRFRAHAKELAGYNVTDLGQVHYNGP